MDFFPVVFARPTIGAGAAVSPSEELGQYAFSSTLSIQDITGDVTSGTSASRLAIRLAGSAESDAYLFALCSSPPGPRPLGTLGYPSVASTGDSGDPLEVAAWVMISVPLLEDLRVIEAHVTIDASIAPLPSEPLDSDVAAAWEAALSFIDELASSLDRPIRQLWVTHPHDGEAGPAPLASFGYSPAFTEVQAKIDLTGVPKGAEVQIAHDMNFPEDHRSAMTRIYTDSSDTLPRGDLVLDTIEWTPQRIRDASSRLRAKAGEQVSAYAMHDDEVIAFAEVMRFSGAEESVIELGATFVDKRFRGRGFGRAVKYGVLAAAVDRWPGVTTGYTSYPDSVAAIARLNEGLGQEIISATTAWQKITR